MSREILLLVDALAREKNVNREIVFSALESALVSATKKRFPNENVDIRVVIDRNSGDHDVYRRWLVVEDQNLDDPDYEVQLSQAKKQIVDIEIGDFIEEPLGCVDVGRIGAQAAKQVVLQKIREAEREQIISNFLERNDKLVTGTVKRIEKGNAIIECGRIEAILRREQMIPKENLRVGDRVKAYLKNVDRSARSTPQIELSRVCPEFLIRLFELEVPEIEDGLLEIKSASRDPGFRAKIAVRASDLRIDPIGTCVGMRGSRVQAVTQELSGERVDIVLWSPEHVQFVINALAPAEITSIVVDEERKLMDVVVDDDNLAIAIGVRGQNVRLAASLTGWSINLMTVEEKQKTVAKECSQLRQLFCSSLEITEDIADILIEEGFSTVEEIAYVPVQEMLDIGPFDEKIVEELRQKARRFLLVQEVTATENIGNIPDELISVDGMDGPLAMELIGKGIVTKELLADLSVSDMVELVQIEEERAKTVIMSARQHWFSEN